MKRLLVLLFLIGAHLETYDKAPKAVNYYSPWKHEFINMSLQNTDHVKWFVEAQKGNLDGMIEKYNSLPKKERLSLINARDRTGATALSFSAAYGKPEVVQWLIDKGADLTLSNYVSLNPLEVAAGIIKKYRESYTRCYSRRGVHEPEQFHKRVVETASRHDIHD